MTQLSNCRVAVLATDGFEESELIEPMKALEDAGAKVTIVAPNRSTIQGMRGDSKKGLKVKVDRTLGDIIADEFDAVHLPGGTINADQMRAIPQLQAFLRHHARGRQADCRHLPRPLGIDFGGPGRRPDADELSHAQGRYSQCRRHLGRSRGGRGRQLGY